MRKAAATTPKPDAIRVGTALAHSLGVTAQHVLRQEPNRERRLRVCHAIFSNPWAKLAGGGQAVVHELSTAMQRDGHEVHTLYSGTYDGPAPPYNMSCDAMRRIGGYNADAIPHAYKLARLLSTRRFDAVFGHSVNAVAFPWVCRRFGVPFTYVFHGRWLPPPLSFDLSSLSEQMRVFDYHLVRRAIRDADNVVVFSQWSRQLLVDHVGISARDVQVIQPGLRPCWYPQRWRHGGGQRLVHWGRLSSQKGVEDLIAALPVIRRQAPRVRLHIVGVGDREAALRDQARELHVADSIRWEGHLAQEDIAELALSCDVAVFPSHVESFGLAVAEAMAIGIPVVRTKAGSLCEVAAAFGTSIGVDPKCPDALAAGVLRALSHPVQPACSAPQLTWAKSARSLLDAVDAQRVRT